jgi:hypothetical protein
MFFGHRVLVAWVACVVYCVTLGGAFVYDDVAVVQGDARLSSPGLWSRYWTRDYWDGGVDNLYRPLVSQSYAFQRWLVGDRPWTFHLVNVILHAFVSVLVFQLAVLLFSRRVGLIAGVLFAVHPIHSEVVAGLVGRAELCCALFVLLGLSASAANARLLSSDSSLTLFDRALSVMIRVSSDMAVPPFDFDEVAVATGPSIYYSPRNRGRRFCSEVNNEYSLPMRRDSSVRADKSHATRMTVFVVRAWQGILVARFLTQPHSLFLLLY